MRAFHINAIGHGYPASFLIMTSCGVCKYYRSPSVTYVLGWRAYLESLLQAHTAMFMCVVLPVMAEQTDRPNATRFETMMFPFLFGVPAPFREYADMDLHLLLWISYLVMRITKNLNNCKGFLACNTFGAIRSIVKRPLCEAGRRGCVSASGHSGLWPFKSTCTTRHRRGRRGQRGLDDRTHMHDII